MLPRKELSQFSDNTPYPRVAVSIAAVTMSSALEQAEKVIPAEVRMFSGWYVSTERMLLRELVPEMHCFRHNDQAENHFRVVIGLPHLLLSIVSYSRDEQTSADVSNVASFKLPDPAGRSGGACTSAMLKVLYADHKKPDTDLSFQEVLMEMRQILKQGRYTQIPQLSSSRPLDIHTKFDVVPDDFTGKRRALLIGINYVGKYTVYYGLLENESFAGYVLIFQCFPLLHRPLARTTQWMPQRCQQHE